METLITQLWDSGDLARVLFHSVIWLSYADNFGLIYCLFSLNICIWEAAKLKTTFNQWTIDPDSVWTICQLKFQYNVVTSLLQKCFISLKLPIWK